MIGGILANNASGMCCGVAENAYRTLDSLTFVLPNGVLLDTAAGGARRIPPPAPAARRGLLDLRRRLLADPPLAERVQRKYQTKNTTGYSLNALLDYEHPLEILAHLFIGSEGTLGFIAEAGLHTLPDFPKRHRAALLPQSPGRRPGDPAVARLGGPGPGDHGPRVAARDCGAAGYALPAG